MTTPASFSATCSLWLDGMDSTTVQGTLAAVSGWSDKSGKSNTLVASATTNIAYSKNTKLINWSGSVATGAADVLKFPTGTGKLGAQTGGGLTGTDFTIFTVIKPTNNSGFNIVLFTDNVNAPAKEILLGYTAANLYMDFGFAGATGIASAGNSLAMNCYKFQTGSKTTTLYQNGTSLAIIQTQTNTFDSIPETGLFVGGTSDWSTFNGSVGEMIIYSSALSDSDRYKVEGYLAWKWGLASSLPAGHAYKTVGPGGWYTLPTTIGTGAQQTLNRNTTYMLVANTTVTIDVPFTAAASSDGLGVVVDGQGYTLTIASVPNYTGSMNYTLSGAIVKNMTIAATGTTTLGGAGTYMFKSSDPNKIMNAKVINCLNVAPVAAGSSPDVGVFFGQFPSNCEAINCGNTGALNNVASSGVFAYSATNCRALNCYNTGALTSYSAGMYGSSASGSIASNCYNSGSATGGANGAIFNQGYPGGSIGLNYISNCYSANTDFFAVANYTVVVNSSYNASWTDSNAVQFLTGAPIPRSVLPASTVGSVWYSTAANTPYTLYSQIPVQYIAGGTLTSPTLCNLAASTLYKLQGPLTVTGYNTVGVPCPFHTAGTSSIFDGSGYTITVRDTTDALGLFDGSATVLNLTVDQVNSYLLSTTAYDAYGWVFTRDVSGGFASNCATTTNIVGAYCCGGIFGGYGSYNSALNCTNNGSVGGSGGGIFGFRTSNTVASNCVNTVGGQGGIFGESVSNSKAFNCINTGSTQIQSYHGGIFNGAPVSCEAVNCINTSDIKLTDNRYNSGGMFGHNPYSCTATNCYNTGAVETGSVTGAIMAGGTLNTATNCYTTNGVIANGGGVTITRCSSNTGGVWRDTVASSLLNAGNGLTGVPISTVYPAFGTVWYSTAPNTPYSLVSLLNSVPCFLAGARILTPSGYRRVETLETGDEVETSDGRIVSIKVFKTKIAKTDEETAPFVIEKGAISRNVPDEDLHVSGTHVIQDARGVWQIPAGLATHPGSRVYQHLPGRPATYYHIECPNFFTDNLVANNCVVESFRNKQGTSENSYEYDVNVGGFVRIREDPSEIPSNVLAVSC